MRGTLSLYLAGCFARWILGMFFGILLLVFLIDAIELIRSSGERGDIPIAWVVAASALRVPVVMERVIPFTVLLGAMAAFLSLSRTSELVIARAAGLSVWQFAAPGLAVAFAIGLVSTLVYNPLATYARGLSDDLLRGSRSSVVSSLLSGQSSAAWSRQTTDSGNAVFHVLGVADSGRTLIQPVFWLFGTDGLLDRRVEAEYARLDEGFWRLHMVTLVDRTGSPQTMDDYSISTSLTAQQVASGLGSPDAISFWDLPEAVAMARASSLPPYRFSLQYQLLLSRPLLLAAMVLIAATVSLGLARAGGTGRMILSGIVAGFVLYVVTEIARGLGSEGLVSPVSAAWTPATVAMLLGATVLLFREDG